MPRARVCRFWPEQREQLVAAAPLFARGGEDAQQRQSAAVMPMRAADLSILHSAQTERAQRAQVIPAGAVRRWRRLCHGVESSPLEGTQQEQSEAILILS